MFEEYTFENILNRMLNRVSDTVDKREGSVIYDALAPMAVEMQLMYLELDNMLRQCFATTADRTWLILRAKERGLEPYGATAPVLRGVFDPPDAPVEGKRFNLDSLNYVAGESLEGGGRAMYCESLGTEGNYHFGTITPVEYIEGLKTAMITELITEGCDEEDTEDFRQRYLASLDTGAFGGNIADYKQRVKALNERPEVLALGGIGQVRVYSADEWNGGGTVRLVITTRSEESAPGDLVSYVQEAVDPVHGKGKGMGTAPVGHIVTVATTDREKIDIGLRLTLEEGYSAELLKPYIKEKIADALSEYNKSWESLYTGRENDGIAIAVSYLAGLIHNITGVKAIKYIDVGGAVFGEVKALPRDSLAYLGELTVEGEVSP